MTGKRGGRKIGAAKKRKEEQERVAELARSKRMANLGKATEGKIIKDIRRIAEGPENPYPGTCSRDRYKRFGFYSEEALYDFFGNMAEAQRAAGLRDARATTAFRNRRARIKTEEKVKAYFDAEVMPWVGKFNRPVKGKRVQRMVVASDFHAEEVSPFCLSVLLDVIKRIGSSLNYVVLNGDIVDFPSVGRWSKPPNRLLNLQKEIDFTRENILAPIRAAAHENTQIDYVIGNHEYRLARFLADSAAPLASLRSLEISSLLGLEDYEISLVHNASLLAPSAKEQRASFRDNFKVYADSFVVTHGTATGKTAAQTELERWGMSGTSGHVHRSQVYTATTARNRAGVGRWRPASWVVTGMLADRRHHGRDFLPSFTPWVEGFNVVTLVDGAAIQQPVTVVDGWAEFAGKIYKSNAEG